MMSHYGATHFRAEDNVGVHYLTIRDLQARDEGRYMCSDTSTGQVLHYMELVVLCKYSVQSYQNCTTNSSRMA